MKKYTAIYIGRRLGKSKTFHAFIRTDNKEEMWFEKTKGCIIGCTYECEADSIKRRPIRTDDKIIDNAQWDAQDALVDAKNAEKRAEAKMRDVESPALKAAVAALIPLCKTLGIFEQEKLIRYLVNEARKKAK